MRGIPAIDENQLPEFLDGNDLGLSLAILLIAIRDRAATRDAAAACDIDQALANTSDAMTHNKPLELIRASIWLVCQIPERGDA